jgi:hypothetical protein
MGRSDPELRFYQWPARALIAAIRAEPEAVRRALKRTAA